MAYSVGTCMQYNAQKTALGFQTYMYHPKGEDVVSQKHRLFFTVTIL